MSAREAEVLAALGEHLTNAEIAAQLFISVRTVESHVSSLLRKLQLSDRRAPGGRGGEPAPGGAARAGAAPGPEAQEPGAQGPGAQGAGARGLWAPGSGGPAEVALLPAPLTSFVGRTAERAALAAALGEHRLVTAVGPGGVGKTRLGAQRGRRRGRTGTPTVPGTPISCRSPTRPWWPRRSRPRSGSGNARDAPARTSCSAGWRARQALLVLDNCEHLLDGMAALVERLLAGSPRLSVLLTSRARLLVPFEWVFPVPGLSVETDGGPGDAVELFAARTAAAGSPLAAGDMERVAAVCRGLDGMALAIELTAARFPSLGLDGIEAGLADRMSLLAGGRRADDRHRSLRSTLDWSYALLAPEDQAVLRRLSVFAAPFTAAAAEVVLRRLAARRGRRHRAGAGPAGRPEPADPRRGARREPGTGRWRPSASTAPGDWTPRAKRCRRRRATWAGAWMPPTRSGCRPGTTRAWRLAFDQLADELRAALRWAAGHAPPEPRAYRLALTLAGLTFARGLPGESQRRYEQAAELAADAGEAATALRWAAGAAKSRHVGDDAFRLHQAAADAAVRAGDRAGAAADLAEAAEMIGRARGLMATAPADGQADALLARAWALTRADRDGAAGTRLLAAGTRLLAAGTPLLAAEARLLAAEAFNRDDIDPVTAELTDRAIALARGAGDPLIQSAALDQLTGVQLSRGELRAALASTLRRLEILSPLPMTARSALEHADALYMATECATAAGDLSTARRTGRANPRAAVPPRGGAPGHRPAGRRHHPDRTVGRGARPGRTVPRGLGASRAAAGREPHPQRLRRGHGPRPARGRRRRGRPGWTSWTRWPRRPGRCPRWPSASSSTPSCCCTAGRPTAATRRLTAPPGQFRDWARRDVATVVRGAVGRGGRAQRASGRRRPDRTGRGWPRWATP